MTIRLNRTLTACLLALTLGGTALAADFPEPSTGDKLAPARAQIESKNWAGALSELRKLNDTGSADWNNLMGYSLRKSTPPDLAGSEKYYNEALRIDPKHRGALSYSGELYLTKGDLPSAEKRLATLEKVCVLPCAELTQLKKSIAQYKAGAKKSADSDY